MDGFLETRHDKFIFRVKEGCFYNREDFWADVQGNIATVGVTDFLQQIRGDVAFLETVEEGSAVIQGQEMGKIETIKVTFGIISPVTGAIIEVNPQLDSSPYLINEDPYGEGWIYKIEMRDFEGDKGELLQAEAYLELMKAKIEQEAKKK
ncbi:Glycine cleavage system H protein [uncultured Desulfobacterium sp.]|uniref:Glycine cleavage system H protein n=1 Tax=uncultured Desulfobacterium sp. TaxID=201089 RepID=A0A445N3T5_9BACT|nr:Glycine cleavage system H protein [uncultured Desulfobacterium sp.]